MPRSAAAGRRLPELKVVCTTGEPLYDHQRALIGEVFGAPVANEFGSRDIGFTAHETPQGQMLLMSESIILEVLDAAGRPAAPGELGEAVMTGLCSRGPALHPLPHRRHGAAEPRARPRRPRPARHRRGGRAAAPTSWCAPTAPSCTRWPASTCCAPPKAWPSSSSSSTTCASGGAGRAPARAGRRERAHAIDAGLRQRLGDDVRVTVRVVDAIAPEASGKHRYVVSHVPLRRRAGARHRRPLNTDTSTA